MKSTKVKNSEREAIGGGVARTRSRASVTQYGFEFKFNRRINYGLACSLGLCRSQAIHYCWNIKFSLPQLGEFVGTSEILLGSVTRGRRKSRL